MVARLLLITGHEKESLFVSEDTTMPALVTSDFQIGRQDLLLATKQYGDYRFREFTEEEDYLEDYDLIPEELTQEEFEVYWNKAEVLI